MPRKKRIDKKKKPRLEDLFDGSKPLEVIDGKELDRDLPRRKKA